MSLNIEQLKSDIDSIARSLGIKNLMSLGLLKKKAQPVLKIKTIWSKFS